MTAIGRTAPVRTSRRHARDYVRPIGVVIVTLFVVGIPMWMVLVNSFKTTGESQSPNLALPKVWNIAENYAQVFTQGDIVGGFLGSLLVTVPSVVGVLVVGSAASWVLARRTTRVMSFLYSVGISGIVLPPAVITIVLTLKNLGLAGTVLGMVGVYMGMFMATVIFFVTGFVRSIPVELEEAARIDGARPTQVYLRIILPLLGPVIATATILVTLSVWNEVFYAFFVLGGGSTSTLPLNLFQVASQTQYTQNWNLIFAYVVIMSLPMLIVFIVAQRRIVSGITAGAVK
ncbi:raffinose/stachyose/melibiose transport system permease protein [Frondihabitans sp. PhB188]|uniref:carbohydrate ABC transporter permease n=1 Tax=Frondihabitans sp. PhB188 TaxID=2485200 RepID=UPI000FB9F41A|nr:carbohydrate ABC transporter permease [Frondihabitans sp. PhB188]ROQ41622.1 raffinose/stachyose/melibiose transport system permease protein [Frondihabitans sp. PhB188]